MVAQPTDRESRLIHLFISSRFDLASLEKDDLFFFLFSPTIQQYVARLKTAFDDAAHLRAAQARLQSIGTLEAVAADSQNQVERRRAATSIIRTHNAKPARTAPPPAPPKPEDTATAESIGYALVRRDAAAIKRLLSPNATIDAAPPTPKSIATLFPAGYSHHLVDKVERDFRQVVAAENDDDPTTQRSVFQFTFFQPGKSEPFRCRLSLIRTSGTWLIESMEGDDSG